jgi:hypothetical protein
MLVSGPHASLKRDSRVRPEAAGHLVAHGGEGGECLGPELPPSHGHTSVNAEDAEVLDQPMGPQFPAAHQAATESCEAAADGSALQPSSTELLSGRQQDVGATCEEEMVVGDSVMIHDAPIGPAMPPAAKPSKGVVLAHLGDEEEG